MNVQNLFLIGILVAFLTFMLALGGASLAVWLDGRKR